MAVADLGIRIFLEDAFSGGFGGISSLFREFVDGLALANGILDNSASRIASLTSSMEAGAQQIEKYQAEFQVLQDQILASQTAVEALQGTGAVGQNIAADIAAGEVLTYEQAVEKARVTLEALQAQGAIFTPAQEESVLKAQADIFMLEQKVRDVEATLPGLNLNPWMNAAPIQAAEAELDKYGAKIVDDKLKLETLAQVGFDKQTAQIDAETAAQARLGEKADLVAAKQAAANAKLEEQNAAIIAEKEATATMMTGIGLAVGAGAVLLGLGLALKTAMKDAADLKDSLTNVQIAFHATAKQALDLQTAILNIANNSQFSSKEISDAFASLAEHGFTVSDVIKNNMGGSVANLAASIKSDTVPAAELLSGAMQVFGGHAKDAAHYADVLVTAFYNGVPHIEQLQQALEGAGAQAAGVHWKIEDFATALDLMAKRGISGSQAGTSLRFMIASLNDPTNKVQEALASMGVETIHTNGIFKTYQKTLEDSSTAGYTAGASYDGTMTSLHQMFAAGQKVAGLRTDKTFYEWAVSAGIVSNKLFDAHGNFKNLSGVIGTLGGALKGIKTPEEFSAWLDQMGGARSGKAFEALLRDTPLTQAQIKQLEAAFHTSGGAAHDASLQNATYNGESIRLKSTLVDVWARIGTPITDVLAPIIGRFADLAANLQVIIVAHPGIARFFAIFAVAGIIGAAVTLLGVAIFFLSTAWVAVAVPALIIIGILVAVSVVATLVVLNWGKIVTVMHPVIAAFGQFGSLVSSFLGPVIAAIGKDLSFMGKMFDGMATDFVPLKAAFAQLGAAIAPIMPYIKMLGEAIGATLIAILLALLGVLVAVASAIVFGWTAALKGLINIVLGIVNIFTGLVLIITGIIQLIAAVISAGFLIASGHSDQALSNIKNAWNTVWSGILVVLQGIWKVIVGVFQASIGVVLALIAGFLSGIINYFSHLYTMLVGHSIIPDLCNGIVRWFSQLPGQVLGFIASLVTGVLGRFTGLLSSGVSLAQSLVSGFVGAVASLPGLVMNIIASIPGLLFASGVKMMQMLASGITSAIGGVIASATGVATAIANLLQHHSAPVTGPLSQGDKSMPAMMHMLASGITTGTPLVVQAAHNAAAGVASAFSSPTQARLALPTAVTSAGANNTAGKGNEYHFHVEVGGKQTAEFIMNDITKTLKMNGMTRLYR